MKQNKKAKAKAKKVVKSKKKPLKRPAPSKTRQLKKSKKSSKKALPIRVAKTARPTEQEELLKKLLREQERLWEEKLSLILSDGYVRQLLIDLAGENALEIIRHFGRESSDEDLSKNLKLKISDVRATLNKLHNRGLVQYNRQKDSETGWYSYSWTLNKSKIENWAREQQIPALPPMGSDHYFCPDCGPESVVPFPHATEAEFRCPHCNKGLEFLDAEQWAILNKR